jgi:hypothetical protein
MPVVGPVPARHRVIGHPELTVSIATQVSRESDGGQGRKGRHHPWVAVPVSDRSDQGIIMMHRRSCRLRPPSAPLPTFFVVTSEAVMFSTILLIVLILALIGALPTWPHSREWGYFPSGGLGVVVIVLLVLVLSGRI